MARIPNVVDINSQRKKISLDRYNGETTVLTLDETRTFLRQFIENELEFFSDDVVAERKTRIENELAVKLAKLEVDLVKHIDEKINKLTQMIFEKTISRVIDEEVNKRLNRKIKKKL